MLDVYSLSNSSVGASTWLPRLYTPAEWISRSTLGPADRSATNAARASSSVKSTCAGTILPGPPSIADVAETSNSSSRTLFRPIAVRVTPSATSRNAIARPIPPDAPVTTATRPTSRCVRAAAPSAAGPDFVTPASCPSIKYDHETGLHLPLSRVCSKSTCTRGTPARRQGPSTFHRPSSAGKRALTSGRRSGSVRSTGSGSMARSSFGDTIGMSVPGIRLPCLAGDASATAASNFESTPARLKRATARDAAPYARTFRSASRSASSQDLRALRCESALS